jgi:hypothetical protein
LQIPQYQAEFVKTRCENSLCLIFCSFLPTSDNNSPLWLWCLIIAAAFSPQLSNAADEQKRTDNPILNDRRLKAKSAALERQTRAYTREAAIRPNKRGKEMFARDNNVYSTLSTFRTTESFPVRFSNWCR